MTLPPAGPPVTHAVGRIADPPTYYEVFTPAAGTARPPVVMIHGGAHTGAGYLATPDGRPGWAQAFLAAGYPVVLPDWPGRGRSGHLPLEAATGETMIAGLGQVLAAVGGPSIVLTHSMSGAYGWKLIERYGEHIAMLVGVAPGPPGNIQPVAEIAGETPEAVTVNNIDGTTMTIPLGRPGPIERGFVDYKIVGPNSTQFPREVVASYTASLNPIPPQLLMERRNVGGRQMRVADFAKFRGKRVLVITGTDDTDHPRAIDEPIVDWLNANGADAEFIWLGDRGISGNGHMLMLERNSDEIAKVIVDWIEQQR